MRIKKAKLQTKKSTKIDPIQELKKLRTQELRDAGADLRDYVIGCL